MKTYKIKITEGSGSTWWDNDTWVEMPNEEDCAHDYNEGATIEIYGPDQDPDTDDPLEIYSL